MMNAIPVAENRAKNIWQWINCQGRLFVCRSEPSSVLCTPISARIAGDTDRKLPKHFKDKFWRLTDGIMIVLFINLTKSR